MGVIFGGISGLPFIGVVIYFLQYFIENMILFGPLFIYLLAAVFAVVAVATFIIIFASKHGSIFGCLAGSIFIGIFYPIFGSKPASKFVAIFYSIFYFKYNIIGDVFEWYPLVGFIKILIILPFDDNYNYLFTQPGSILFNTQS